MNPNIAQLVERPTVDVGRDRTVPGSNPGVRTSFFFFCSPLITITSTHPFHFI